MAQPIVLVTFYCRSGQTETLALSHAVGAVQGRALIRLRRVADVTAAAGTTEPELQRMLKEYVEPTEKDLLGADAIAIAPPPRANRTSPEWSAFLDLLARLGAEGKLAGKTGAIVDTGDAATVAAFSAALVACGLTVVPPSSGAGSSPESATAHGKQVAETAGRLKQ